MSQADLKEAKQASTILNQRTLELEGEIRARDRVTAAIEGKTGELEKSLVGFSAQIMELRGEISVKEHVSVKVRVGYTISGHRNTEFVIRTSLFCSPCNSVGPSGSWREAAIRRPGS